MSQTVEGEGSNPLQLSEIVANVMQHVNKEGHRDAHTLFSCLQVNSLWFHEATTCLWAYEPPIQAITNVSKDHDRCQYYADKLVVLNYEGQRFRPYLLELDFPGLEQLKIACDDTIDYDDTTEEYRLFLHLVQPKLKSLKIRIDGMHEDLLIQIKARCPLLVILSLTTCVTWTTTDDVLRFLESAPSITDLTLRFDDEYTFDTRYYDKPYEVSDELLVHLAERQHMQILCIDSILTVSATHTMLERVTQPFHHLPVFRCLAENQAFEQLVSHLPELEELHVELLDHTSEPISAIACCTNLRTLAISMEGFGYYSYHDAILTVAEQCTQLRSLSFCINNGWEDNPLEPIEDKHIEELSVRLPKLTTFRLGVRQVTELTVQSLRHLGEACPRLEVCYYPQVSEFAQLELSGPPILPQLKTLQLYGGIDAPPPEAITNALHYHAPMLKLFDYNSKRPTMSVS